MMRGLYDVFPSLVIALLELVPTYGSWRDLIELIGEDTGSLRESGLNLYVKALKADNENPATISLAAKWAPRENSVHPLFAKCLAARLFPEVMPHSVQMKAYRKLISRLNTRLKTVETLMSAGRWDEIIPATVPGRAGKLYARAFLNLVNTTREGETLSYDEKSELRKPNDIRRMICRENFQSHYARAKAGTAKVHGADTLFPHEVVQKARDMLISSNEEKGERDHLCAVWQSMVTKAREAGGLGRSIFMSDFSGSMQSSSQGDTPYWVSMALGLLGAETVTDPAFRNRFLTFDSTPTWHQLPAEGDLFARLLSISESIGQGMSTNFQAAMELILETMRQESVKPGEEPENLIVLTDMNWDAASRCSRGWQTHVEMIRESFRQGGWKMPRIVIWNLAAAAGQTDFHATAHESDVAMLSGWSPSQFKVLCEAGPRQLTSLEILRIELDDPQYNPVRQIVRDWISDGIANHSNGFGAEFV